MSSLTTSCCCGAADCGLGLPIVLPWKVHQGDWETATNYVQYDLALASNGRYYVAKSTHTSGSSTEPGTGVDWATVWDLGEPQMRCAWYEVADLQYKDCMPVYGFDPDDDPAEDYVLRFGSGTIDLRDAGMGLQSLVPILDAENVPTGFIDPGWYPGPSPKGCFWLFAGCCGCPGFDPIESFNFAGAPTPDSLSITGWTSIHVRESIVEVSIHAVSSGAYSDSAQASVNADCDDEPCFTSSIPDPFRSPLQVRYLYFQGAATIPSGGGGWIDTDGVPVSDLVITNDLSTDDIGKIIRDDDGNPLAVIAGGGGTFTIKAGAHAAGWESSIGNAMSSAGSVPSPQDCTEEDPPLPDPPDPPFPPPPPPPPTPPGVPPIPPWYPPLPPAEYCTLTPCPDSPGYCVGGSANKNLLCALLGIVPCDPEGLVVIDALGCCLEVGACTDGEGGSTTVAGLTLVSGCDAPQCPVDDPCNDCTGEQPSATVSASMTCAGHCGSTMSGTAAYLGFDSETCTWSWDTHDGDVSDPYRTAGIQYDEENDEWIVTVVIFVGDPTLSGGCYGSFSETKPSGTFSCDGGVLTGSTSVSDDGFSGCTASTATVSVG